MKKLVQVLSSLVLMLVFLSTVAFSFLNTAPVGLSLGFRELGPQPLSVWVILAFFLGGLLGLLFGTGIAGYLKTRRELRLLRRRLADAEAEVAGLKAARTKASQ